MGNADDLPGLVAAVDRQNAQWVEATRRISPSLLITLLRLTGHETAAYFQSLDLTAIDDPVSWAGPDPAPVWLDVAREYTERWTHQQHIRDAVGRPGLKEPRWFGPVLATFVWGVPRALRGMVAADGTAVRLTIQGEAGGAWTVVRAGNVWTLAAASAREPVATVDLDQETAWRLFTQGIDNAAARWTARLDGDLTFAERVLDTVAIIA